MIVLISGVSWQGWSRSPSCGGWSRYGPGRPSDRSKVGGEMIGIMLHHRPQTLRSLANMSLGSPERCVAPVVA